MPSLAELKAENLDAWARDVHAGDYALVVNTSCSRYIPALEAEIERLQKVNRRMAKWIDNNTPTIVSWQVPNDVMVMAQESLKGTNA